MDANAIDVWLTRTNVSAETLARASELLDDEERQRAARFRFDADRARSIVSRSALRHLLGRHRSRDPRELRFVCGAHGKPALVNGELEFNVSHSADWAAIAIASHTPVGVDVEHERSLHDLAALTTRYFAPPEAEAVLRDPSLFFPVWTAKESVIKATGDGLSLGLASFEVSPSPRFTPVRHLDGWFVISLPSIGDGYHAALCARGDHWSVSVRQFHPSERLLADQR
jgi:4'-phosphopantetheinyl transferase